MRSPSNSMRMAFHEPGHNGQASCVDCLCATRNRDFAGRSNRLNSPVAHYNRPSLDHRTGSMLSVYCDQPGVAKSYESAPSSPWNSEIDHSQQLALRLARAKDINLVRPAEDDGI